MKNFRDLLVWEKAHQLTLAAYKHTTKFPLEERYGLTSQIRRSASSVPANIAEGCGRRGNSEFHRFLQIAMGSASELEYHLLLARDLQYLGDTEHVAMSNSVMEVKRMLAALIAKVEGERLKAKAAGM